MSTNTTLKNSAGRKSGPEPEKILPPKEGQKNSPLESAAPTTLPPLELDGSNEELGDTSPRPSPQGGEGEEARQEPRPTDVFDGAEERMAERLGLSREHLVALRQKHLKEGVEFERVESGTDRGAVRYHQAGAERLLKLMALPPEALQALIRAALPALPPLGKPCVVVVRRAMSHRSVVEGYLPGMDPNDARAIVRIRVRGNLKLYTRGMQLPCVRVSDDLFECTAQAPRWKGKF